MHWINPDGQFVSDDPIYVYCDMDSGSTTVVHDSETPMDVGHCAGPGCYSKAINYNATIGQMSALAQISGECHQSIKFWSQQPNGLSIMDYLYPFIAMGRMEIQIPSKS
ncbi:hypothetical protein DAPPUDRAFT_317852 [Daphnia pulex]|uniref:Fibrillar collagen NC1 domain-containing protein n=1 Tax=Daphnia pulex TaxID=6669 RepID=E9GH57_DAPPU|nr:hypothetical protein DAPPUDRAFT_317852 [Daphnia pulex]|eukprot:EFX81144.1 hypothetical protein DAPPUDRAFT_317852 [Daphnia pulex]